MEIRFERARLEDVDSLLTLCREAARAPGSAWNERYPDADCLREDVALGALYHVLADGERVGVIAMGDLGELNELAWEGAVARRPCEIARFGLLPAYQGRGLGRQALRAALELCASMGYDEARVLVIQSFSRAVRMYEDAGFERVGEARMWGGEYWMCRKAL